jgi:GNAT superfamily N-acetyltransferase
VFVAESKRKIIGFIVYKMQDYEDKTDNIVVTNEEQGKGVGRALVEYVEGLAKSIGLFVLKTDTARNADCVPWKAYRFWKKMGCEGTKKRISAEYGFKVIPLVNSLK